ncbi:MAG TPA: D-arabinono-1,4-lactone oxidase, partial [Solirubrobacteraceae bacterium]|nr:D-arabinono-1,4-lactone oxidase [Solirubrobacteraceae bacterium]
GRVRVPGSLPSCSKIVVSATILDTSGLPKTMEFDANDEAVAVSANTTLHDFLAELSRRRKSVTATGGVDHQTLAGLISTGTAPASPRHALYDLVDWMELVTVDDTGRAVERRIARGEPAFAAAICSLGLLGVLTRVRFRTVDELFFDTVLKIVRLDDVLPDLEATSRKYDFWRVNWVPKSEKALLWAATAVPPDFSKRDGDYPKDESEHILDTVCAMLDEIADTGPLLNRALELIYDGMALTYKERHHTGPMRTMLPVDRRAPLRVAMAEWSFRPQDVQRVLGECQDYFDDHGWPNIPTEIELTRVDGNLMSAWNWEGLEYVVKFNFMYLTEVCTQPGEKEAIYAHLRGLWDHFEASGVPFKAHWGKINFIDPEFVRRNHGWDAFRPLIAPMFVNDYLAERIGPL